MTESQPGGEPQPSHSVADRTTAQVRSIIEAAEDVADSVKREADERARSTVEQARDQATQMLRAAQREADGLLLERRRRISELSDTLMARGEALLAEFAEAQELSEKLRQVAARLEDTAAALLAEADTAPVRAAPGASAADEPPRAAGAIEEPLPGGAPTAVAPHPPTDDAEGAPPPPPDPPPYGNVASFDRARDRQAVHAEPGRPPASDALTAAGSNDATTPGSTASSPADSSASTAADSTDEELLRRARLVASQMAVAGGTRKEIAAHLQRSLDVEDPAGILNAVLGSHDARL